VDGLSMHEEEIIKQLQAENEQLKREIDRSL
jgi:hypothetical protein